MRIPVLIIAVISALSLMIAGAILSADKLYPDSFREVSFVGGIQDAATDLVAKAKKRGFKKGVIFGLELRAGDLPVEEVHLREHLLVALTASDGSILTSLNSYERYNIELGNLEEVLREQNVPEEARSRYFVDKKQTIRYIPDYKVVADVEWAPGRENRVFSVLLKLSGNQKELEMAPASVPLPEFEDAVRLRAHRLNKAKPVMRSVVRISGVVLALIVFYEFVWWVWGLIRMARMQRKGADGTICVITDGVWVESHVLLRAGWNTTRKSMVVGALLHLTKSRDGVAELNERLNRLKEVNPLLAYHLKNEILEHVGEVPEVKWLSSDSQREYSPVNSEVVLEVGSEPRNEQDATVSRVQKAERDRAKISVTPKRLPQFVWPFSAMVLGVVLAGYLVSILRLLPDVETLSVITAAGESKILDDEGSNAGELFNGSRYVPVDIRGIPVILKSAVVIAEDPEFYSHYGSSWRKFTGSGLPGDLPQSRWTITQQLARRLFKPNKSRMTNIIARFALAYKLEKYLSKDEILELYLNSAPVGGGAHGIGTAAKLYFNKHIADLTPAQFAVLAGLLQNHTRYSPVTAPEGVVKRRRNSILNALRDAGVITKEVCATSKKESLMRTIANPKRPVAPYFMDYVREEAARITQGVDGLSGVATVHTTLSQPLQQLAGRLLKRANIGRMPVSSAMVVMEVKTGAIKVVAGISASQNSPLSLASEVKRDAGMLLKPYVVASALAKGFTPSSKVQDLPAAFYYDGGDWRLLDGPTDASGYREALKPLERNKDFKVWVPESSDGTYMGDMPFLKAIRFSRDVALNLMVHNVGEALVFDVARKAGISALLPKGLFYGEKIAGIPILQLAAAFSCLLNGGIAVQPYSIQSVYSVDGKTVFKHTPQESEVFSAPLAYLVTNVFKNYPHFHRPVSVYHAASADARDFWLIAGTPDFVVALWLAPMKISGTRSQRLELLKNKAYAISKDFFDATGGAIRDFPVPEGIVFVTIDADTGRCAGRETKNKMLMTYGKGMAPC